MLTSCYCLLCHTDTERIKRAFDPVPVPACSYYFVANHSLLSQSQHFSCHICFGDVTVYGNRMRPFSHLCHLWIRSDLLHTCFASNVRRKSTVVPTPRTIFMHSPSRISGSLRTSPPPSKVRIPSGDWTATDWTVIFTWKINPGHFWVLCLIILASSVALYLWLFQALLYRASSQ